MRPITSAAAIGSGPSSRPSSAAGWSLTSERLAPAAIGPLVAQLGRAARFDAVILQRKLLPAWQLATSAGSARRLVFDFDDAVLYRDSYDPRGPHLPAAAPPLRADRPAGRRGHRRQRLPGRLRPPRRGPARARPGDPDLRRSRATTRPAGPTSGTGRASTSSGSARRARCKGLERSGRSGSGSAARSPGSGSG